MAEGGGGENRDRSREGCEGVCRLEELGRRRDAGGMRDEGRDLLYVLVESRPEQPLGSAGTDHDVRTSR